MDLDELKQLTDKGYQASYIVREEASTDIVFYHVTQWDDGLQTDLAYRGEFDVIKQKGRQIMAELRANPVQVDFEPVEGTPDETASLLDGMYRADDRINSSQESYTTASMEAVVCGVGAWEMYTEELLNCDGTTAQVIRRSPIHEANNVVYWDPNSKLMDKSDAAYVCILVSYTKEAYKELAEELVGEDAVVTPVSFRSPQISYSFPWIQGDSDHVWVASFYHRELVKDTKLSLIEPLTGNIEDYWESDLGDNLEDLMNLGYTVVQDQELERYRVTKYIASGMQILEETIIANEFIPVIPTYGERAYVEGQETWSGLTRSAKDPQRLRNFMMSYIADIASKSPRPKPIFYPEQIQGLEKFYNLNGADDNFPYSLMNPMTLDGKPLPPGPVGVMPEQTVPMAVSQLVPLTKEAIDDVTGVSMPRDFADIDLSGTALTQLNARIDQQTYIYQENMKHSKRRDGEIYASFATRIHDVPKSIVIALPDGTRKEAEVMKQIIDPDTGEPMLLNDLRSAKFQVFSDIGPTYQSQKDEQRKEIGVQLQTMAPDDPMRLSYQLVQASMMDGDTMKPIREQARRLMIQNNMIEEEDLTDEEKEQMAIAAQTPPPPDANMVLAQAEMGKAQAAQMREQNNQVKISADIQKGQADTAVDVFEAQTQRFSAEAKAENDGVNTRIKGSEAMGRQYQALVKDFQSPLRASVNQ